MVNSADIQKYLQRLHDKYQQWWKLYRLLDEEYEPFDFRVEVQTEEPVQENNPTQHSSKKKRIPLPFPILDGIDRYVAKEHVLLVGQPGSGKSTALVRFLLKAVEQARLDPQAPIPVLIELRRYKTQSGVSMLIQDSLKRFGLKGADIEELRFDGRPFLLLLDGLNELPSSQTLTDLRNFREDCADLNIPMVVTTRTLDGNNLGIERQLEVKSLTPSEIQRFLQTCLPQESKQRLHELSDRLRELGQTPLMLWMLYVVLKEPQGNIPDSRGELFRRFIRIYERKREEKVYLDDETQRWWTRLLKPLAFEMMRSSKSEEPTGFKLEILKRDAETICKDFLKAQAVNNYSDLAIRCLNALIDHHLIQFDPEKQEIEFCHQLLQEYYAAEWLLERLDKLSNEQLQYYFLNYLKWKEAIGLMLALVEQEEHALRVVKLALGVDRRLGARLAGEVQLALQAKTVAWLKQLSIPELLKVKLLSSTKSVEAMPDLLRAIQHSDFSIRWAAATALGQINREESVPALLKASKDPAPSLASIEALGIIGSSAAIEALLKVLGNATYDDFCLRSAYELGKLGNKIGIQRLREALNHQESSVIRKAISALKLLNTEAANSVLLGALQHPKNYVRILAVQALGEIGNDARIPDLLKVLEHEDSRLQEIVSLDESVINALGRMGGGKAISALLSIAENRNLLIRRRVLELLGSLTCKAAIPILKKALKDRDVAIRGIAAISLGQIGDELVVPDLLQALEDDDGYVRANVARALRQIGSRDAVPKLLQMLTDEDHATRWSASDALGKIGGEETIAELLKLLKQLAFQTQQIAARTLGLIGDKAAIPGLIEALEKQEELVAAQILQLTDNEADISELTEELEGLEEFVVVHLAVALTRLNCCLGTLVLIQKLEHLTPYGFLWGYFCFDLFGDLEIEAAIPILLKALEHQSIQIRHAAASALDSVLRKTENFSETFLPVIRKALENLDEFVFTGAISVLRKINNKEAVVEILKNLDHPHLYVRLKIASALAELDNGSAISVLLEALDNDEDLLIRKDAACALGKLGSKAVVSALLQLLSNENSKAQTEIIETLGEIGDPRALTMLQQLELQSSNYGIKVAIATIQERCQFYNYAIAKSDPPPAVSQDSGVGNHGQTTPVYQIGRVDILNTGNVNIHGNQIGDTSN